MNKPKINLVEAVRIAETFANIENDDPCCVSGIYENDFYALTVYTAYQKYEFYVQASSGEVAGMISEPVLFTDDEYCTVCA